MIFAIDESDLRQENGHALLELSIVIFALLVIGLSALEGAQVLQAQQNATALSKELSGIAFRECLAERTAVGTPRYDPQNCFNSVVSNEFRAKTLKIAPTAEYIVSLYTYDGTNISRDAYYEEKAANSTFASRFSSAGLKNAAAQPAADRANVADALIHYQSLVIGEISVPYSGLDFISRSLIPFDVSSVYASSIL
jgi:hypothetical protein